MSTIQHFWDSLLGKCSGSRLPFGPDKVAAQWLWHYLTSWARGKEKQLGKSAKLNLSSEAELTYSWEMDVTGGRVGSSLKTSSVLIGCVFPCTTDPRCVFEGEGVPGRHISGAKRTTGQTNSDFRYKLFSLASIWSSVLCDSFPLWIKGAKNSCQWPGNAVIEFKREEGKMSKEEK